MFLFFTLLVLHSALGAIATTHRYDWELSWVTAAPDGFSRPVIGVNGEFPSPTITVMKGDRLIIKVHNELGNQSTAVHWHGIHQRGSPEMDGAAGVTQCPIPTGASFTYDFTLEQGGTFWYHSHYGGQYPDGLRGALIVKDPDAPWAGRVDEEITMTLSDWYHPRMPPLLNEYLSPERYQANDGHEHFPSSALINDRQGDRIQVRPNKTYLFRIINIANFLSFTILFDQHPFTVVEIDGIYMEDFHARERLSRLAVGQRISVLVRTKPVASYNFEILSFSDVSLVSPTEGLSWNSTAYLTYDGSRPTPTGLSIADLRYYDELELVPLSREAPFKPNKQIVLQTSMEGINSVIRGTVDGKTYLPPKVPSLYTALSFDSDVTRNPRIYGHTNPIVIRLGDVVQMVINNNHDHPHPWHLHGHTFQVLERPLDSNTGPFSGTLGPISATPIQRDTVVILPESYVVIRFKADNPGVWLLHCHIEWHIEGGMTATIVEAPDELPDIAQLHPSHINACKQYPMDYIGNAAGKVDNPLNLTGVHECVVQGSDGSVSYRCSLTY
ncbi:conidial pigment biosynthesis oxidase Abr1/brown 1 [Eremomyces bilateralis CBS 781.70]|uniref:Conidial pigment biosynthesis oxidase Abr1/brown 1 n=1 Tax=Eremomyces bilateralis CBS 781.70 TaxID=1392243 RepID=A0A6G1G7A9_9PEZI|nr:conidial pigment biosynthesis oxidase Abr1/brown 1 [Eremomyces bilateralis CBS 781.70]KAF1813975.1 conidial pigment biosynthesis oxidase Abr1/brown 1 [Eremomyces bilateralis CBS 781.70]